MMKRWTLIAAFVAASCASNGSRPQTYHAVVEAGTTNRVATPVFVELALSGASEALPVCVASADGQRRPGQIETLENGTARVWWIADIPAGMAANYALTTGEDCSEGTFSWQRHSDQLVELQFAGRPQIQYEHPVYNADRVEETKKPFHQVYDPDGSRLITKGLGGLYPHHRGIFYGFNEIYIGDDIAAKQNRINIWSSAAGEYQQHIDFVRTFEGPVMGGHAVLIDWNDLQGRPFAQEVREVRVYHQPDDEMLVEFVSSLRTLRGRVYLGGNRHHGGVQFRAAQPVADHPETLRYLRPAAWAHLPADEEANDESSVGLPWNAIQYPLEDREYTVAALSAPANPRGAEMGERSYGRFGEYFPYEIDEDRSLELRYRFWISAGGDITRETVESQYHDLASPPRVTVK